MTLKLKRISYSQLNAKQKENYNFQKLSAILADYGFVTMRLTDDWKGADFVAVHIDGQTLIRVQLKGRLTFDKKYIGKDLYIAFESEGTWFLYPHDNVLNEVLANTEIGNTKSWMQRGCYSFPRMSKTMKPVLAPHKICPIP